LSCGATILSAYPACPECGFVFPVESRQLPRIYDLELRAVFAGADTPSDAKGREYRRLREFARQKGWSVGWVVREYRKLFSELPAMSDVTDDERRDEYRRLVSFAAEKNYKPGFALVRYKDLFGAWPRREWRA
jgi:hypothetical protein